MAGCGPKKMAKGGSVKKPSGMKCSPRKAMAMGMKSGAKKDGVQKFAVGGMVNRPAPTTTAPSSSTIEAYKNMMASRPRPVGGRAVDPQAPTTTAPSSSTFEAYKNNMMASRFRPVGGRAVDPQAPSNLAAARGAAASAAAAQNAAMARNSASARGTPPQAPIRPLNDMRVAPTPARPIPGRVATGVAGPAPTTTATRLGSRLTPDGRMVGFKDTVNVPTSPAGGGRQVATGMTGNMAPIRRAKGGMVNKGKKK